MVWIFGLVRLAGTFTEDKFPFSIKVFSLLGSEPCVLFPFSKHPIYTELSTNATESCDKLRANRKLWELEITFEISNFVEISLQKLLFFTFSIENFSLNP